MNKLDIVNRVLTNTGRTDKAQLARDAINDALQEAASEHLFQSMYSESQIVFSAGSNSLALPDGTFQLVEARVQNGASSYPLNIRTKRWVTRHFPNPTYYTASCPVWAFVEAGQLFYTPTPSADLPGVLTCVQIPTLDADTDVLAPGFLSNYVIAWVTGEVYRSVECFDEAAQWDRRAQGMLALAIKADNNNAEEFIADQFPDNTSPVLEPYKDPFYGLHDPYRGI